MGVVEGGRRTDDANPFEDDSLENPREALASLFSFDSFMRVDLILVFDAAEFIDGSGDTADCCLCGECGI